MLMCRRRKCYGRRKPRTSDPDGWTKKQSAEPCQSYGSQMCWSRESNRRVTTDALKRFMRCDSQRHLMDGMGFTVGVRRPLGARDGFIWKADSRFIFLWRGGGILPRETLLVNSLRFETICRHKNNLK